MVIVLLLINGLTFSFPTLLNFAINFICLIKLPFLFPLSLPHFPQEATFLAAVCSYLPVSFLKTCAMWYRSVNVV